MAVFGGVILQNIGVYLLSSGFNGPVNLSGVIAPTLLQAAVSALITPWIFDMTGWATSLLGLRQRGQRE